MNELALDGCRTNPLSGYLSGVGVLRAVTRLLDPAALGHWAGGRFVLTSRFTTVDELVEELGARFEPEAIVSPWNAGSGFAGNGKNATAERLLQHVRSSSDVRLAPLAAAVAAGDAVVAAGRAKGWGGAGDELWDKSRKAQVLQLCRNTFPDTAVAWIDAAAALGIEADPAYSRLLGTGGNFGRQDLSATYVSRAITVLTDRRGAAWLHAAVTGDESVPYLRDAVGQFDPGRAGGIQSSPWEKADDKGFVNPWSFLLTLEGALLFAGAVVRRLGSQFGRPALPFQVMGSTGGFATAAPGESSLGEIWVPEWSEPVGLDQVQHLLAEGRAEWRDAPARSGLDFARAIATLGVDRGIDAFNRHVFVDRLGQNPLAVPAGRVVVSRRGRVGLLADLDSWLNPLRGDPQPAGVTAGIRRLDNRLYELATTDGGLPAFFAELGHLVETVGRSGSARAACRRPLMLRAAAQLLGDLRDLADEDVELRLALALATAHDGTNGATLRGLLQPVRWERGWAWVDGAARAPLVSGLGVALAECARWRSLPGIVKEQVTEAEPGVRGCRVAYAHGLVISTADRHALVRGRFDPIRTADLLAGLLCVDWPPFERTDARGGDETATDPAVDLLLPFTTSGGDPLLVRPGRSWASLLAAGRAGDVLDDARHRLLVAGCDFVVTATAPRLDPHLLAASLLLCSTPAQRRAALDRTTRTKKETA